MPTEKKQSDAGVSQLKAVLTKGYGQLHPRAKIEVYRHNPVSIRVRIIDPDFKGRDRIDRDEKIWPLLESLPEKVRGDISVLLLITPEERKDSLMSREFDEPARSWL